MLELEGYPLEKTTDMKGMNLHLERSEEQRRKFSAVNESLCVTKDEIISLPMTCLRPKQSTKPPKKLS